MKTLIALLSLVAVPLSAQTAAKVEVKVINVDVSVVDSSGKPVNDLKQDDFEVLEDNQPEKITNFALINRAPARPEMRTPADMQLRRRVILLIDNNYIDKT